MSRRRRIGIAAGTTVLSAITLLGVSAGPAMASPSFCTYDLCVTEAAQTYNTIYLHTYTKNQAVTGFFRVQTPEHTTSNSPDTNYAAGNGWTFALPYGANNDYGSYCITLYKKLGPGNFKNIAYGCITL
ncbi:MAG: hypothetical protein QOJ73_1367 [Streptosporangiaceae bacterium]|jgi:hypothetical protein|nr:hypothetical protein [Streptosporangiaceae bacterium]